MKKYSVVVISFIPAILFVAIGVMSILREQQSIMKPLRAYEPEILDDQLEMLWAREGVISEGNQRTENLFSYQNHLYLYGAQDSLRLELWSIDRDSGEFLDVVSMTDWATPFSFGQIDSLIHTGDLLYIAHTGKGGEGILGGVSVLNLKDEDVFWATKIPHIDDHVEEFAAFEDYAVIHNGFDYYLLDAKQQARIKLTPSDDDFRSTSLLFAELAKGDLRLDPNLWIDPLFRSAQAPIVYGDKVVISQQFSDGRSDVFVFNLTDASQLFVGSQRSVSNVVRNENKLFYLTDTSDLVSFDLNTGEQEQLVSFRGENLPLLENRRYFVSVDERYIFVYMGASRQLFAFKFTES